MSSAKSRAGGRAVSLVGNLAFAAFAALLGAAALGGSGCGSDDPDQSLCTDIPDGGCPLAEGLACTDPGCQAAYACEPGGQWVLDHVCPPNDAQISEPVPPVVSDGAAFDAPAEDLGCPGLEMPDCSVDVAASCSPACCGCEDLWTCKNGGWLPYGTCDATGIHPDGDDDGN